jgi:RNA polymerase sigma-70 factor, ECF subfamily
MDRLAQFNQHRSLLFAIAYRMVGTVTDAEDLVQETFLRWRQAPDHPVRSARAYLSSIITRLCIDHLRSARVQREQYVGTWLPEPILAQADADPATTLELADTLSTAFLVLLESLSPVERAVFLLREAFDYEYDEIAAIVDKSPINCRQIVRRAKQSISSNRPRFTAPKEHQEQMVEQFLRACQAGDFEGLLTLLSKDITVWSDGGGKARSLPMPLKGAPKVARFFLTIRKQKPEGTVYQGVPINGQFGILTYVADKLFSVTTFDFSNTQIESAFITVNPDKLKSVALVALAASGHSMQ